MGTIVIKDLADSVELDREAMAAITGGARLRGRQSPALLAPQQGLRIIDYPPGVKHTGPKPASGGRKAAK